MDYYYLIALIILIILSAYFSATETAFSSLNKTRLKALIEKSDKKSKKAELTLNLSEKYDKLISTILIGNNIVNIGAASLATVLFVKLYGDIGATISTIVLTITILIFGEISPKSIAKDCPEKFAMFSAPYINILIFLFTPINFIFSIWKKCLQKLFGVKEDLTVSQEELLMFVEEIEQGGSIDEDAGELIKNAISFGELEAGDIITHRVDVEAVNINATKDDISKVFADTQYSRLLVFEDNIDNIIGVIHLKDFFNHSNQALKDLMTEPLYIQKSEKVDDLLKLLQKNKSHIAVVVDEFGGTKGIVTMEDILEELVGDIWDEHDEVVENFKKVDENTYIINATVNTIEFSKKFEINLETDNVSVGGWVIEQLCKLPEVNDTFVYDNYEFKVVETDSHRITQIELKIIESLKENEE